MVVRDSTLPYQQHRSEGGVYDIDEETYRDTSNRKTLTETGALIVASATLAEDLDRELLRDEYLEKLPYTD